ncbi:MAG: DUF3298 and DUF4163 domain-containing protein [Aureispira sp.]|nr:DUF3298 and DUF4163 domain-containing protein [Aureispira sp.]
MGKYLSFILAISLFLISCGDSSSNTTAPPKERLDASLNNTNPALSFKIDKVTKKEGDCDKEDAPCVVVDVDVPVAIGGEDGVAQAINENIKTLLVKTLDFGEAEANKNADINAAVANVVEEFNAYRKDVPDGYPLWEFAIASKVTHQSKKLVSIQFDTYANTGGAHPNSWMDCLNFDANTGKLLDNTALIKDKKGLTTLAETKFRAHHELGPNDDLVDAGFEFQYLHIEGEEEANDKNTGVFALPNTIGINNGKLLLCYNAYDIAAYVVGPTVLEIPLAEVEAFLNMQ